MDWLEGGNRRGEDGIRQGHGQDTTAGAGEGMGNIVVLRYHRLGLRHGGQTLEWFCVVQMSMTEMTVFTG